MYNPDFWEIQLDQTDLEQMPNESGPWFETREDRETRYLWEDRIGVLVPRLNTLIFESLTGRQREAVVLYFKYGKTQQEVAKIMGISRRVVSQHLFGITRNGKLVGGAVRKIQRLCKEKGIAVRNRTVGASTTELNSRTFEVR